MFELDTRTGELRKRGIRLKLPDQSAQILAMLLEQPGELITRERLQNKLWPDGTVVEFDVCINAAVKRLRRALGDTAETPRFIETLQRHGYRFIYPVPVTREALSQNPETNVSSRDEGSLQVLASEESAIHVTSSHRPGFILLAVAALLLFGIVLRLIPRGEPVDSLAVIPFENAGDDPRSEVLTEGMTEALINSLSQLPNLKVKSRDSVFRYRYRRLTDSVLGRELNVRVVLRGRVRQQGDTLHIAVELVDTRESNQIWGQEYTQRFADLLAVQEDIVLDVIARLGIRLDSQGKRRLTTRNTENLEAYEAYLNGRFHINTYIPDATRQSITYFERAIARDGNYALAYAGLAHAYVVMVRRGGLPPRDCYAKARVAAMRALALDESLAEAHYAFAMVKMDLDRDWRSAEVEFKRAVQLGPNMVEGHHQYSHFLTAMGRVQDSLAESKRILEIDPLNAEMTAHLGFVYLSGRQFDRAIEQFKRSLGMSENYVAHLHLGQAYEQTGRYPEAINEFHKALGMAPASTEALAGLGHAYGASGQKDQAQKILAEFDELAVQHYVPMPYKAIVYAGMGDRDSTLRWLDRAYKDGVGFIVYLNVDPKFDNMRVDPEFQRLLMRIGLKKK